MARRDETVQIDRSKTRNRTRDVSWRGRARRALTGNRRWTVVGVLLVVLGLVAAGLTVVTNSPTSAVPAAAVVHTPTPTRTAATSTQKATPAQTPAAQQAPAQQDPEVVQLQWGDTLWGLAQRYGTTVAALQQLNGLGDSTLIYAGQQLRVSTGALGTTAPPAQQPDQTGPVASVPTATLSDAATSGDTSIGDAASVPPADSSSRIFAFSGANSADLASDPDVAGRSLVYYWGQLEPQPGVYNWNLIDQDMAPWVAAGKKVILRVAAAGWASWDKAADSAHGTPAWVYAQGVKSVTEKDGAVLPEYWNPTFLGDYDQFLQAFAARYDGDPNVALVDVAVGVGGETKPDSEKNPNLLSLWQSIGYTDQTWWGAVQHIIDSYSAVFTKTPLALMPDKTFLGKTAGYSESKTVNYAVAKGIWLQDNGLLPNRTLSAPWGQTPVVSEQRDATSSDGNSLAGELQAATANKSRIILLFTADLTNPADQAIIHQYATGQPTATTTPAGTTSPGATGTAKTGKTKARTAKATTAKTGTATTSTGTAKAGTGAAKTSTGIGKTSTGIAKTTGPSRVKSHH